MKTNGIQEIRKTISDLINWTDNQSIMIYILGVIMLAVLALIDFHRPSAPLAAPSREKHGTRSLENKTIEPNETTYCKEVNIRMANDQSTNATDYHP